MLLENIYIQKTCYNIKSNSIERIEDDFVSKPESLLQSLPNFESGRVYKIIHKDSDTNFFQKN